MTHRSNFSSHSNSVEIVCAGIIVVDAVGVNVSHIPNEGGLALFEKAELHLGGCAANTALALSKLGVAPALIARIGTDGFGDFCVKELARHRVESSGLRRSAGFSTSFSFIMIPPSGNRRIFHTLAANASLTAQDIGMAIVKKAKWLCVGGLGVMPGITGKELATVLKKAQKAGVRTAADTAINDSYKQKDWEQLLGPCYRYLDVFFPSEHEARAITGKTEPKLICEFFQARGVKIAGVKLGERGNAVISEKKFHHTPAYKVKCVDTLGAGDCFMAGLLTGLLRGYAPEHAAQLGNAVSAHCVQAVGATAGVRPLSAILTFQKGCNDQGAVKKTKKAMT